MAIMTTGPAVAAISGTVGGANFAVTRYGQVIRKRACTIRKTSQDLCATRAYYHTLIHQWWDYTDQQRLTWRTAAERRTYKNRLGHPRLLSGFQFYMKIKILRRVLGAQIFTDPPLMWASIGLTSITLDFTSGGALRFSATSDETDLTWRAITYGSRPMRSTAISHFSYWRLLGAFDPRTVPAIITTHWNAALGHPQPGEIVALRCFGWIPNELPSPQFIAQGVVS